MFSWQFKRSLIRTLRSWSLFCMLQDDRRSSAFSRLFISEMSHLKRKHVLLISFPAFGHYIPFLELASKVHEFHDVTLAVSSFKESDIRQRDLLPPAGVRFLPVRDGLDTNFDVNFDPKTFLNGTKSMKPHYDALLEALTGDRAKTRNTLHPDVPPIDAVILDSSFHILSKIWGRCGVPVYSLCPYSATLFETGLSFNENTPAVPDEYFYDGTHEDVTNGKAIPESVKAMTIEMLNGRKYVQKMFFNSFDDLEREAVHDMAKHPIMARTSAYCIGPLIPRGSHVNPAHEGPEQRIRNWLDKQRKKSVVYVSLGNMATPSAKQLTELGEALFSLGRPFIWSLRSFQQCLLPEKFLRAEARSFPSDAPYLILPWVSQKAVLAHRSVAVFLSHCGWNSALEALSYGIPVCAWPMFGDQHPNAVLLQENGVAEILHDHGMKSAEIVPAEKIREVIESVAGWNGVEDPDKYVRAAAKYGVSAMEAVGPNGSSTKNFSEIMGAL